MNMSLFIVFSHVPVTISILSKYSIGVVLTFPRGPRNHGLLGGPSIQPVVCLTRLQSHHLTHHVVQYLSGSLVPLLTLHHVSLLSPLIRR